LTVIALNDRPPETAPVEAGDQQGSASQRRFSAFSGVFTPSILTIVGVIMYLRFGWVVGNVGLAGALLMILLGHLITASTGLSIASIATNRMVRTGGAYYMISRSLGAPMGAAIGIPLFLAQALSITFYVVGFVESISPFFPQLDMRLISVGVLVIVAGISIKSAEAAIKIQYVIMALIGVSLISIAVGSGAPGPSEVVWFRSDGESFAAVFAVFFPAVTGIMSGVSMSGDLKDPRRAIPMGTMAAIGTGFVIYIGVAVLLGLRVPLAELDNDNLALINSSWLPQLVYAGLWGAALSSAFGSMLSAPRTLQALAWDGLAPRWLGKGSGPKNEPRLGLLFTFSLALVGVLLGDLDAIAPLLTMFFLATYGMINLACGLERWAASPSFRPSFAVSKWISLAGAVAAFYVMSIINLPAMLGAMVLSVGIYIYVERKELGETWGDARHGIWAAMVRWAILRLRSISYHPQNWRPNLVIFGGDPEKRAYLLEIGCALVQDRGMVSYFVLLRGEVRERAEERRELLEKLRRQIMSTHHNALTRVDVVPDVYSGVVTVAQTYGIGPFEINTVMLGWPGKPERQDGYVSMLQDLAALDRSILIVRPKPRLGFERCMNVHVWWGGLKGNGALMLLLAFLLKAHDRWRSATFSVMTIVNEKQDQEQVRSSLEQTLQQARIEATPVIIRRDGRPVSDIMAEQSKGADLVIMGLALNRISTPQSFFDRTDAMLKELPTTIMVHSGHHFQGEPVLFDDPPQQG